MRWSMDTTAFAAALLVQCYLPCCCCVLSWARSQIRSQLPFFPTSVLIQINRISGETKDREDRVPDPANTAPDFRWLRNVYYFFLMAQDCNTARKQPELFSNLKTLNSNTSLKQGVVHPSVRCTFTRRHRTFSPTLLTQFQNFLWAPDLIIRSTKSQIAAVGKGDRRPPSNYCNQRQVPQVSQRQRRAKLLLNLHRILKESHAKTCLTL